ncbi:LOW QUALITY PROTEIN: protein twisted gastrulation-like [Sitophilus oryzae]|uniref:LOW QUALITY PROTEIN: protein twisted gastrulation-like n=1 Tax=Sitophilus oryzae TaxID=7048 RepID=A0A6J2XJJ4_SITOR|nr:LOW QUALITY PROTEIN: protein twisted gastrulation-like [Sitophilus oryzae]
MNHIIPLLLSTIFLIQSVLPCNEAVCGSVVSKCLLTESSNCDLILLITPCCKGIAKDCLGYLYTECCSCVGRYRSFWAQCMSWTKCKSSCQSMGAESFRWFHDGCCECVGDKCINYGINESRCSNCPVSDELIVLKDNDIDEDEPDFGENDDDTEYVED